MNSRLDVLELIESGENRDVATEKETLDGLIASCKTREMNNVVFDPTIVRGFDYYTGVVFEVFDTHPENTRSMFGGGRYDNLVSLFGGDAVPAVGFGMGDVTLLDFLTTHGYTPKTSSAPTLYLGTPDEDAMPFAQEFATTLREHGISVIVHIQRKSLGDQIKDAHKRSIPYFIAYGKQEYDSGMVRLKTLAKSEEKELTTAEVLEILSQAQN
jgi:histidyl-tRNA synthetase